MKPRKPDRFERAATRAAYKLTWDKQHPDGGEFQLAIVKELRREHAWMRRMTLAMYAIAEEMELSKQGFKDLVIEQLAQRRK